MSWTTETSPNLVPIDDDLDTPAPDTRGGLRNPRLLARWALTLAVCYTILYTPGVRLGNDARQLFIAFALGAAFIGTRALLQMRPDGLHRFVLPLDVLTVSAAIAVMGNATSQFFLAYFLVLVSAAFATSARVASLYSFLVTGIYSTLLFWELGFNLLRSPDHLLRVGFVCGMGLVMGLLADESQHHRSRVARMASRMDAVAHRARTLARDKYRLRALSEIGRLGLVGSSVASDSVLFEISKRIQRGVGVDRVSLVIFAGSDDSGFIAASSDDEKVEVRPINITEYPELQETIAHGEIVEVHPGKPKLLWDRIQTHLPEASEFRSFLVVPIKTEDRIFGAFFLRDREAERTFDEEEQSFCWAAALMTASFIRGRDLVEQLRSQSRVDGLTGLLNFQAFNEELEAHLDADNAVALSPYSLVVLDMDNLKQINDLHGHVAGNRAIVELGDRLREALPHALAMCRYGGDEFVALVHASAADTAERMNQLLNALTTLEWDEPFNLRTSIGVAQFPDFGDSAEAILESADQAMYLAKGKGGHRIRVAEGSGTDQQEIYDAVVAVQTKRKVPKVSEAFDERLRELQRHAILGLRSPLVRQSIAALAQAVESIDPNSRFHSRQVASMSRDLCLELGIEADDILKVETAGYLHDVGKINVPAELLTKETPLTDSERDLVRSAPTHAATLLESLPGLKQVANLVRTYHERWDGSGYPAGLAGKDIPFGAQIVGICDVYHALVSPRAQRPALPLDQARRHIEKEIGRLWNPVVGRAFLNVLARIDPEDSSSTEPTTSTPWFEKKNDRRQTA